MVRKTPSIIHSSNAAGEGESIHPTPAQTVGITVEKARTRRFTESLVIALHLFDQLDDAPAAVRAAARMRRVDGPGAG
jgi:hypothetical protein